MGYTSESPNLLNEQSPFVLITNTQRFDNLNFSFSFLFFVCLFIILCEKREKNVTVSDVDEPVSVVDEDDTGIAFVTYTVAPAPERRDSSRHGRSWVRRKGISLFLLYSFSIELEWWETNFQFSQLANLGPFNEVWILNSRSV